MLYRPNTHGEIIEREWSPNLTRLELRHLPQCHGMAHQFWTDVLNDARISKEFEQDVAYRHLNTLRGLHDDADLLDKTLAQYNTNVDTPRT